MSILTGILTLYGLGIGGWLTGQGVKSAVSSLSDTQPELHPVNVSTRRSFSGRCHIENVGFYAPMKKFVADVVCPETGAKSRVAADTIDGLEKQIKSVFDLYEWRLNRR